MKLGIIGGSGLYEIEGIQDLGSTAIATPFGPPSDEYMTGKLSDVEVVFLPRHGKGHRLLPGELNHRANIFGMKKLGVTHIVSISAVGSLKKEMKPRDVVIVDQYFDRTKRSMDHTFFGNGLVGHIAFGEPVCPELSQLAGQAAETAISKAEISDADPKVHHGGTYINMEGPAFSTKAESRTYQSWGMDVIGMTNLAEAKLAREAEICYTTVAMVTDYDCWHPDHDDVTVEMIIKTLLANVDLAKQIVREIVSECHALAGECVCGSALASALITNPDMVSNELRQAMAPIIGKYLPVE